MFRLLELRMCLFTVKNYESLNVMKLPSKQEMPLFIRRRHLFKIFIRPNKVLRICIAFHLYIESLRIKWEISVFTFTVPLHCLSCKMLKIINNAEKQNSILPFKKSTLAEITLFWSLKIGRATLFLDTGDFEMVFLFPCF